MEEYCVNFNVNDIEDVVFEKGLLFIGVFVLIGGFGFLSVLLGWWVMFGLFLLV